MRDLKKKEIRLLLNTKNGLNRESFQIWDHFFPLLFTKDSKNLKSLDIRLKDVGAERPLNRVRNTDTKKILLSKAKFALKQFFARQFYTLY